MTLRVREDDNEEDGQAKTDRSYSELCDFQKK